MFVELGAGRGGQTMAAQLAAARHCEYLLPADCGAGRAGSGSVLALHGIFGDDSQAGLTAGKIALAFREPFRRHCALMFLFRDAGEIGKWP